MAHPHAWADLAAWIAKLPDEVEAVAVRTGADPSRLLPVARLEAPVEADQVRAALEDVGGAERVLRLDAYASKGRHVRGMQRTASAIARPADATRSAMAMLPEGADPMLALTVGTLQSTVELVAAIADRVIASNERLAGNMAAPLEAMTAMFREEREEAREERLRREQSDVDARELEALLEAALTAPPDDADPLRQAAADALRRVAGQFTAGAAAASDPEPVLDGPDDTAPPQADKADGATHDP
jgi:hypothetical protein